MAEWAGYRSRAARIAEALGPAGARWFRAPGRVNLMGDHTDHQDGLVLPVAIDRDCVVASRRRIDGTVHVRSLNPDVAGQDTVEVAADGSDDPAAVEPAWGRYVAGVVRALADVRRPPVGMDAVLASTVPLEAGLASSAALEVACALALAGVTGHIPKNRELANACRRAEHMATGVPCGVMDQLTALEGRSGVALLIDCRIERAEPVAIARDLAILAVHSGQTRALAGSAYAERAEACAAAARDLGLDTLRDATPEQAAGVPLARHVVSENARVEETARALSAGDRPALARLFAESHTSLRDDFGVSTPELDALVAALVDAGAVGARMTGAGFGGCVVALVERRRLIHVAAVAVERYRAETGLRPSAFVCRAVDGAGRVRPEDVT